MFFMLHLNEDFDDDLLSDAIELLHGSWSLLSNTFYFIKPIYLLLLTF
jgi:hypothetical protein